MPVCCILLADFGRSCRYPCLLYLKYSVANNRIASRDTRRTILVELVGSACDIVSNVFGSFGCVVLGLVPRESLPAAISS